VIEITPDAEQTVFVPGADTIDFDLSIVETPITLAGAVDEQVTVRDVIFDRKQGATVRFDAIASVEWSTDDTPGRWRSLDETRATVDASGKITTTGSGSVGVLYQTPTLTKRVDHNARTDTPSAIDEFTAYVEGSLGEDLNERVDNLLGQSVAQNEFTTRDDVGEIYVRNNFSWPLPGRVMPAQRLSGRAVWNSQGGAARGATLITQRHVVMASHYAISVGQTIRWTDQGGVNNRVLIDAIDAPGGGDLRVGRLNAPVDVRRGNALAILPGNFADKLTPVSVPVCASTRASQYICREWFLPATGGTPSQVWHRAYSSGLRGSVSGAITAGDSGQPVFVLYPVRSVLLGLHWYSFGFINLAGRAAEIQAIIDAWGDAEQVVETDLAAFPSF
jgi:hypothetical protein